MIDIDASIARWAHRISNIEQAIADANKLGIKGKELTPYLLDHIQKLTGGQSLESNIRLVYNNAALAAKIACCL